LTRFLLTTGANRVAERTVRALLDERAHTAGDSVFLIDPETNESLSYSQVRQHAVSIAVYLAGLGVKPGDSVAYAMNNGRECVLCLLGMLYCGVRATAVNLIAGKHTIGYVLGHSEARVVLLQPTHRTLIDESLAQPTYAEQVSDSSVHPQLIVVDDAFFSSLSETSTHDTLQHTSFNGESDALLMYTSGTTGRPKGVVLTQSSLIAGGETPCLAHELTTADRALCVLPLFHINGLCVTVMGPLVSGGSVVMPSRFSASSFWGWIQLYSCTWFSVVPTQISYLLHAPINDSECHDGCPSVRFGRSASAPLSPDVQRAFEQRFNVPIVETMGLTETAAQILSNPLPPATRKVGSAGLAYACEVIIADEHQAEVSRGAEGEVLVRGRNVMKHYFKNVEATSEAVTDAGWLRTGDLGRMDDDGYVFITGRLKELIIKGGENIAPREVDEALYRHPDVIEAAAFPQPCSDYGQRIEAAVSLKEGSAAQESELLTLCEQLIGDFKRPDRIHFLRELPKGPSGKIQRIKLVEMFDESTG